MDITWNIRQTHVRKQQIIHILRATRKEIMEVIGGAPDEMEMQSFEILSSYSLINPAWQLTFNVANLLALQKVLRHFEKSNIPYEFYLEC